MTLTRVLGDGEQKASRKKARCKELRTKFICVVFAATVASLFERCVRLDFFPLVCRCEMEAHLFGHVSHERLLLSDLFSRCCGCVGLARSFMEMGACSSCCLGVGQCSLDWAFVGSACTMCHSCDCCTVEDWSCSARLE